MPSCSTPRRAAPTSTGASGTELVRRAAAGARAAGCDWLHVDFRPELAAFYLDSCGFRPTDAGLIALRGPR